MKIQTSKTPRKKATGALGMSMLLLAGKKLKEPIVRHGPFVMNTKARPRK